MLSIYYFLNVKTIFEATFRVQLFQLRQGHTKICGGFCKLRIISDQRLVKLIVAIT